VCISWNNKKCFWPLWESQTSQSTVYFSEAYEPIIVQWCYFTELHEFVCWIQKTALHAIWRRQEHAYWIFSDWGCKISRRLQLPTSPNLTLPAYVREVVLTKMCTKKKPIRKQLEVYIQNAVSSTTTEILPRHLSEHDQQH